MISQLGYVGLGVKEMDQWREFATAVLGLAVVERAADGALHLRMDEYRHRFILHPNGTDDIVYAGWMLPTPAELDKLKDTLRSSGIPFEPGTSEETKQRRVLEMIHFSDPNGLRVEAFYGLQVCSEDPFLPGRAIAGFKAGALGLGHLVLVAKNLDETTRFYRDVLGLRISDFIDYTFSGHTLRLVFLHANPRHHSVAFGELPGRRKLIHFMLELRSIDDVGTAYDVCQKKGIRISSTIGRHSNDQMISFYMISPSGFEVEYGFGGRLVDDSTWVTQYHKTASMWGHHRSYLAK